MFATLVIALPSKHEGGEVRVTHSGKTKKFETSKFSEFDASYLAWYAVLWNWRDRADILCCRFADVTHKVRPVLAGHRLVLTYNLSSYELNRQRNNRINGCNCRGIAVMFVQYILRTDDYVK